MKFFAVALLVGLTSATFTYVVTPTPADGSCDDCDAVTDADSVTACLADLAAKPACGWELTATLDAGTTLTTVAEACLTDNVRQAFGFPAEMDHGVTFPSGASVDIAWAATDFQVTFGPLTPTDCVVPTYTTLDAPAPPLDCANAFTSTEDVTDLSTTPAESTWKTALTKEAKYIVFEFPPTGGCWTADEKLAPLTTTVASFVITATSEGVPEVSSSEVASEDSSSEVGPEESSEVGPGDSSSEVGPGDSSSEVGPEDSSSEIGPEDSSTDEVVGGSSSDVVVPGSSSDEVGSDSETESVGPLLVVSSVLFAAAYASL